METFFAFLSARAKRWIWALLALFYSLGSLLTATEIMAAVPADSGQPLLRDLGRLTWQVIDVDSEELVGEDGSADHAIDGDPDTYWHTEWQAASPPHPHEILIDLGASQPLAGLRYLPRQSDTSDGTVLDYALHIGNDPTDLGEAVASGSFDYTSTDQAQQVLFPEVSGRYARFVANSEINGGSSTSAAELSLLAPAGAITQDVLSNGGFEQYDQHSVTKGRKTVTLNNWIGLDTSGLAAGEAGALVDVMTLPAQPNSEVWANWVGLDAPGGNAKLLLDHGAAVNGLYQQIPTHAGSQYRLSLQAYAELAGSSAIEVWIAGQYRQTIEPSADWQSYQIDFLGDGLPQSIMLRERPEQNDGQGALIDQVSVLAPTAPGTVFQVGTALVDSEWLPIPFTKPLINPVVILGPPSANDAEPGIARLAAINDSGFELRFQEWAYLDGAHDVEEIDWLALEAGHYVLPNGVEIEAGHIEIDQLNRLSTVDFQGAFSAAPAVFLSLQHDAGADPVALRAKQVSATGFKLYRQKEEALRDTEQPPERVGYLAIHAPAGSEQIDGYSFQFAQVSIQTTPTEVLGHSLWIEEEQSLDDETSHVAELVDVLVFDQGELFAQDVSTGGNNTAVVRRADDRAPDVALDGLMATSLSHDQIGLIWNPATGDDADLVAAYRVTQDNQAIAELAVTQIMATGLAPETSYSFQVQALDAEGEILASSNVLQAVTEAAPLPPEAPTNLVASNVGWSSLNLSWQPANSGPVASLYKVYRNGELVAATSATSHTETNLASDTTYHYLVSAVAEGLESLTGASLSVTTELPPDVTPPAAPTWLHAAAVSAEAVSLSWTAAQDDRGVAGYRVLRDGVQIGESAVTEFVDTNVEQASSYGYAVLAFDAAGNLSALSDAISVTTPDVSAPSVPNNLVVEAIADRIHVSWGESSDNVGVIGYELERDGVSLLSTEATGYVDAGAAIGSEHGYRVRALDAAGNASAWTDLASATIVPPAITGEDLAQTCMGCHGPDGQSAGAAMPNLAGMRADYFQDVMAAYQSGARHSTMMGRIAGAYSADEIALMADWFQAQAFQPAVQLFDLELAAQGAQLHVNQCASCHGQTGAEMQNGVLGGQWRGYLAASLHDFAAGLSSDVPTLMNDRIQALSSAERDALVHYYASLGIDSDAPSAPTDLAVPVKTETSVTLTWVDADDTVAISHYEIWRDGQQVGQTEFNSFTDVGLAADTLYGYTLVAVDLAGNRSLPSVTLAVRTEGGVVIGDPSVEHGLQLWQANGCATCHGDSTALLETSEARGLTFEQALQQAIAENLSGMGQFSHLNGEDIADIQSYVVASANNEVLLPAANLDGVLLLSNAETLRKASILLAARLPTADELALAETNEGLDQAVRELMQGERFRQFLLDASLRRFLTGNHQFSNGALRADFPVLQQLLDTDRNAHNAAIRAMREEAVQLARYIVENDLSWQQILTADYTLVNRHSAAAYGAIDQLAPFATDADEEFQPARLLSTSARTPELAAQPYPHAGVLTTRAWLSRFPTTDSNRNRHRSRMFYLQFLGVDIEALGQRPLDDSQNGDYLVPTMENSACLLCHTNMEPVAGAFQNWGASGQYWENDEESLSSAYKGADYYLNHAGEPWHREGDKWFRDMLEPGFEGKDMPGGFFGFNRPDPASRLMARDGWSLIEATANRDGYPAAAILDGDPDSYYHTQLQPEDAPMPHVVTIDMGELRPITGLRYLPRQYGTNWHIQDYQIELSDDGVDWRLVSSGTLSANRDAKDLAFSTQQARYFRLTVFSQTRDTDTRSVTTIAELDALQPPDPATTPHADNANGASDSLQWLAREVVDDPRFAMAAVRYWYTGLFGVKPLDTPLNQDAPGYAEQLAAYQTQQALFEPIAAEFAASGYRVKDLLVSLVSSDLFRAKAADGALDEAQLSALNQVATGRLLGPNELDAKALATVGRPLFGDAYLGTGLLYGGFDGGKDIIEANSAITTMLVSTADAKVNSAICDFGLIRDQFNLPANERQLLPYVEEGDEPRNLTLPELPVRAADQPVERLVWSDFTGNSVAQLESFPGYPMAPGQVQYLSSLDTLANSADYYGDRLRAYLVPPETGEYTFWVAGDNRVSLRLAPDRAAAGLVEIAAVSGFSSRYQWDKYPEQQSAPIQLVAGQAYLLEVLHTERAGNDHVSVSWAGPGLDGQPIIAAAHLTPTPTELDGDFMVRAIKRNIQHLHAHLLGEQLSIDDEEIERTYALFAEVFNNPEPLGELAARCEDVNGRTPVRRAWSAVLAYLMADFRYLNH